MSDIGAIIIGAGQAGLAVSHELTERGIDHVILEKGQIGESWRNRWDSFCLVTPNWSVQLPGFPYDGGDPDGFMPRDEIVAYLQSYAAHFHAPVQLNTQIREVRKQDGSGFVVEANAGSWRAKNLILATGAFQKPRRLSGADSLPKSLHRIGLLDYHSADALPTGDVLIVGSGQSGCQIAEELHDAGRRVVLSCGRAPWFPRRISDHDLFWWMVKSGFADTPSESLPLEARLFANVLTTGHDGGHDLNLRILRNKGVTLTGRFLGADNNKAQFANDLADSLAWGDAQYLRLRGIFNETADKLKMAKPDLPDPESFDAEMPSEIDLGSFGTVLFSGGFRPDFLGRTRLTAMAFPIRWTGPAQA